MSNIKLFGVRHSNVECQNDLKVKLFDIRYSKDECQNGMSVEVKLFNV